MQWMLRDGQCGQPAMLFSAGARPLPAAPLTRFALPPQASPSPTASPSPEAACRSPTPPPPSPTASSRAAAPATPPPPANGGAISASGAAAAPRILGCRFWDNYANFGGAIHVSEGAVQVEGCEFLRNDGAPGTGQGGALYFLNTRPSLVRDTLVAGGADWPTTAGAGCPAGWPVSLRPAPAPLPAVHVAPGCRPRAACCTSLRLAPPCPTCLPHGPSTSIPAGSVGFSGGAISAQLAAEVRLERVRAVDNKSGSFAGAILVWGSNVTIVDSELINVSAAGPAAAAGAGPALHAACWWSGLD